MNMRIGTVLVSACVALAGCFDDAAVQTEADALEARISGSVGAFEERLATLEEENAAQGQAITDLQDALDSLGEGSIAELASRVAALEGAVGIPYDPADDLDTRVTTLEQAGFVTVETDPVASAAGYLTAESDPVATAAGYLTAYTETDPVASAAGHLTSFTETDPVASAAGYLTAYTETDPVASAAGYLTAETDPVAAAAGYLTVETDPVASAAGYLTEAELELCPLGYVHDASETQFTLCYDPDSALGADEMVRVGDFWVDRYEGSAWSDPDCTVGQYGATTTDDYPADLPDTGNWNSGLPPVYACSVPGVTPSRMLTWFQAQQSCAASGKDLCSNEQWQAAAAGTWDPGAGPTGDQCNTSSSGARTTGSAGSAPADSSSCMSAWGAEDMVGNLWEWTGDWYAAGMGGWMTADGQSTSPWPASYDGDQTWNLDGRAHNGTAWTDALPAAALRGGYWGDGASAGVFALHLGDGPSRWSTGLGFRCCRSR